MKYIILIGCILSYSTGFINIALLIILYFKHRSKPLKYYIYWLINFSLIIFLINIEFFRNTIMYRKDTYYNIYTQLIYFIINGAHFYILPLFINNFCNVKFNLTKKIILGSLSILTVINIILPYLISSNIWERNLLITGSFKRVNLALYLIIIYLIVFIIINYKKIDNKIKRTFLKFILSLTVISFPVWIFEYYWNYNYKIFLRPLSISNFYYFILNLGSILFIYKHVFSASANKILNDIPGDFINKYNITNREKEIILYMAKGLANKQIAYELKISSVTVKNHIYNIYIKTGVDSKIELINLINSKYPVKTEDAIFF